MLPSDLLLVTDKKFAKYTKQYAKDNAKFFKDFAAAFQKLEENGCTGLDADGVGLTSLTTGAPRVLWWATRHNERRARDPLTINNTQSTYESSGRESAYDDGQKSDSAVVIDGRERSYVTESDSKVIARSPPSSTGPCGGDLPAASPGARARARRRRRHHRFTGHDEAPI